MISMVEGAKRQITPNEKALTILLVSLTIIFLLAVGTLKGFSIYSEKASGSQSFATLAVLVSLIVCLIPTTIGGLLSAIGISGMDRMMRKNVLAMSGKAVEAAGDIDVLLLDKTGTITLGNRMATAVHPGVARFQWTGWPRPRNWRAFRTKLPKAGQSWCWPRRNINCGSASFLPGTKFIPFSAKTRISGVDLPGRRVLQGWTAPCARAQSKPSANSWCDAGGKFPHGVEGAFRGGGAERRNPARGCGRPGRARPDRAQGCGQGRHQASGSRNCAAWASAP